MTAHQSQRVVENVNPFDKIGKYELRREAGRGAIGVVYEARDNLNRPVALKMLRIDRIDPRDLPEIAARFKREAESLARLAHPHIAAIHDYGEWQGTPYLVTDFMQGTDLATDLKASARFPPEVVVRIMTQLLGALAHAHERGVVHGDLRPANLFLLEDGALKVVDFGLAKIQDSDLSTTAYLSPEQVDGLPPDHRSELFSAGVILYELLTGGRPFRGESADAIRQAVRKLDPLAPSDADHALSPVWDGVIARALAKKPSARFESARQFAAAIEDAQQAERVHAVEKARARSDAQAAAEEMAKLDAQARAAGRGPSRAPLIAAMIVGAVGVIGAAAYGWQLSQDRVMQAEASRAAAETRARDEAGKRAKAETLAREETARRARLEDEVARKEAEARRIAELAAQQAVEARALAQAAAEAEAKARLEAEARREAELAARKELEEKARQAARRPGRVFQDCADCPPMVVIPAGAFTMGSPATEEGRFASEGPQHRVVIQKPFAAGRYEVTFAEWDACFRAAGCAHNPSDPGWGRDNQPVINVSWRDAKQFVAWLSRKTGKPYRLLTEAEWEYAGRAGTATAFGTGEGIAPSQANFKAGKTVTAGSYRPNAFGLFDVHGNAWEWVEDCWNANYTGAPANGTAWMQGDCSRRVIRGGSWDDDARFVRSAFRDRDLADHRDRSTGFRLARTLE